MEFMMEDEIQLEDCSETTFVSHNQSICSEGGCREMRFDRFRAGAEFIAAAVSQELDLECLNMTKVRNGHTERSADLANAADELMSRLDKLNPTSFGEIRSSDSEAPALARAVLLVLANRNLKEARALAGLFATDRALRNATETLLRSAFTLPRVANI